MGTTAMNDPSTPPRFDRILVASDGSEFSADAVNLAIGMAARCGARLRVVAVVLSNTNPELENVSRQLAEDAERAAMANLQDIKRRAQAANVEVSAVLRYGIRPTPEILAEAAEWGADLIVVGRRGKRGLARMMVGQATANVIGNAPCNVLVVPRHCQLWQSRILLASDGSRFSAAAALVAGFLARKSGLPLSVVTVVKPDHSRERRDEAMRLLERVCATLTAAGAACDSVLTDGQPAEQIVSLAAARGADMIVVGSHGRSGLDKLLMGSVTERVVGQSHCPVLVVKC